MLTPAHRRQTEEFRTVLNALKIDGDGLANTLMEAERSVAAELAYWVAEFTRASADDTGTFRRADAETSAWHRTAVTTSALLSGERGEQLASEWIRARGDLPPMEWPDRV